MNLLNLRSETRLKATLLLLPRFVAVDREGRSLLHFSRDKRNDFNFQIISVPVLSSYFPFFSGQLRFSSNSVYAMCGLAQH